MRQVFSKWNEKPINRFDKKNHANGCEEKNVNGYEEKHLNGYHVIRNINIAVSNLYHFGRVICT